MKTWETVIYYGEGFQQALTVYGATHWELLENTRKAILQLDTDRLAVYNQLCEYHLVTDESGSHWEGEAFKEVENKQAKNKEEMAWQITDDPDIICHGPEYAEHGRLELFEVRTLKEEHHDYVATMAFERGWQLLAIEQRAERDDFQFLREHVYILGHWERYAV